MPGFVLTLPLALGKIEAWRRFCEEIAGPRRHEHEESRRRLGITHERTELVEKEGKFVTLTTIEVVDLGWAVSQIISSGNPFDQWYRVQIRALCGVNLASYEPFSRQVWPLPHEEVLFEWTPGSSSE